VLTDEGLGVELLPPPPPQADSVIASRHIDVSLKLNTARSIENFSTVKLQFKCQTLDEIRQ